VGPSGKEVHDAGKKTIELATVGASRLMLNGIEVMKETDGVLTVT
jgi:hypothetical protein